MVLTNTRGVCGSLPHSPDTTSGSGVFGGGMFGSFAGGGTIYIWIYEKFCKGKVPEHGKPLVANIGLCSRRKYSEHGIFLIGAEDLP